MIQKLGEKSKPKKEIKSFFKCLFKNIRGNYIHYHGDFDLSEVLKESTKPNHSLVLSYKLKSSRFEQPLIDITIIKSIETTDKKIHFEIPRKYVSVNYLIGNVKNKILVFLKSTFYVFIN